MTAQTRPDEREQVTRAGGPDRGLVTREIAGETIIVPIAGHVGDLNAIFTMNEVGSRIWHMMEHPIEIRAIVDTIAAEYDVPRAEVSADVAAFLESLDAAGLIRRLKSDGA